MLQIAAGTFIYYRPTGVGGVSLEDLRDVCLLQQRAAEEQLTSVLEYCSEKHEGSLRASCAATRASFRERIRRDLGNTGSWLTS